MTLPRLHGIGTSSHLLSFKRRRPSEQIVRSPKLIFPEFETFPPFGGYISTMNYGHQFSIRNVELRIKNGGEGCSLNENEQNRAPVFLLIVDR